MLVPMKVEECSIWKNTEKPALFNIRIPAIDIGVIMVKAYMTLLPHKTISTHQVKEIVVYLVWPASFKNGTMNSVVNDVEEIHNDQ